MTLYDIWLYLLQSFLGTIKFFKDHPTVPGLIYVIFKQNSIRKIINKQLPRGMRDNLETDVAEMKQDLKEIKIHMGVGASNSQLNGSETAKTPISITFYTFLQALNIQRRLTKMNLSGKKKILAIGVAILINGCNDVFGLHLTPATITTISTLGGGYVLVEAIIDIVRAWANRTKEVVVTDAIPAIDTDSNK